MARFDPPNRVASRPRRAANIDFRLARPEDIPAITRLISMAMRELSEGFYTPDQVERALDSVVGTDPGLITDGTYFVAESDGEIIGAGGWSFRDTVHCSTQCPADESPPLNPATDAAKIRAFFVHPKAARQGIATRLFKIAAEAARSAGFTSLELMATLPGEPLYLALGFEIQDRVAVPLRGGLLLPCVLMSKKLTE